MIHTPPIIVGELVAIDLGEGLGCPLARVGEEADIARMAGLELARRLAGHNRSSAHPWNVGRCVDGHRMHTDPLERRRWPLDEISVSTTPQHEAKDQGAGHFATTSDRMWLFTHAPPEVEPRLIGDDGEGEAVDDVP